MPSIMLSEEDRLAYDSLAKLVRTVTQGQKFKPTPIAKAVERGMPLGIFSLMEQLHDKDEEEEDAEEEESEGEESEGEESDNEDLGRAEGGAGVGDEGLSGDGEDEEQDGVAIIAEFRKRLYMLAPGTIVDVLFEQLREYLERKELLSARQIAVWTAEYGALTQGQQFICSSKKVGGAMYTMLGMSMAIQDLTKLHARTGRADVVDKLDNAQMKMAEWLGTYEAELRKHIEIAHDVLDVLCERDSELMEYTGSAVESLM